MKNVYVSLLIGFLWVIPQVQISAQTAADYDSLDIYIKNAADMFGMPGIAIGIVKDDKIVFNHAYGFSNTETKTEVTPETVFAIASCSKAFTTACLSILADQGKINWDDRVIDHYPEFQMYDPYVTSEMRIEDLVCHRSGLQTFDGDLLWYGSDYSREEVVKRIRFRENSYSFRSHFGYQNVMFIAAGEVIKNVTGESWDTFLSKNIFNPLNMNSSTTSITELDFEGNVAWPHVDGEPIQFINYDNVGPAASINTSVNDMLKWIKLLLHKGMLEDSSTVFSSAQYYQMVSPHTLLNAGKAETPGEAHFYGYGLGWFVYDYQGKKVIQHGGGLPGFHSKTVFIPEENVGYVILANQLSGMVEAMYRKILDMHLGAGKKDWAKLYFEGEQKQKDREKKYMIDKEEARVHNTEPSLELKAYTGIYEDKMYGKAEITLTNGDLQVCLLPTKDLFTAQLNHWHYNTFSFSFNDPFLPEGFLTFFPDQDLKPSYFTIELENQDFHFYKLKFEKVEQ
ncbi:MAG: serine hydrolase [Bacteroidales bacterium]